MTIFRSIVFQIFLIDRAHHLQAFGWAYLSNQHNTWEQFYVYWICPFISAILAALIFRIMFVQPAAKPKAKKA
jgi:aquaporin SIP